MVIFNTSLTVNSNMKNKEKCAALGAILGIIIFIAFTLIAIVLYPNYNQETQYLSALGAKEPSAMLFNFGLMVGGLLSIPFFLYLKKFLGKTKTAITGTILLLASSISLMGIGFFPSGEELHTPIALLFFLLILIGVFLVSKTIFSSRNFPKKLAYLGFGFVVIELISGLLAFRPIHQKITVLAYCIWVTVIAIQVIKLAEKKN